MGRDKENLFHRKKASAQVIKRAKAVRAPYSKVLIVCEGKKTEKNYFEEIKNHYELSSTNIEINTECGSAPINVVRHAIELYKNELRARKDAYDKVFCVFDRDTHSTFDQAVDLVNGQNPKGTFNAITSTPCFEYWFLLHFLYTQQPFRATQKKSAAEQLEDHLRSNYWPEYKKNASNCFKTRINELSRAKIWAGQILSSSKTSGIIDPLTNVHELVDYLQNIKN
ncbi:RloB family protein [Pseudomonas sp. A214]|uniref:RloB family protein n=1 Tax=Pseudomonas sp. A214 TaxID=1855331 RepID=UPI000953799F|nr:RloB family protein [Pseudomonas sp. A214]SIR45523.1 RloB-like protein [Pseudomonas sp. A214]